MGCSGLRAIIWCNLGARHRTGSTGESEHCTEGIDRAELERTEEACIPGGFSNVRGEYNYAPTEHTTHVSFSLTTVQLVCIDYTVQRTTLFVRLLEGESLPNVCKNTQCVPSLAPHDVDEFPLQIPPHSSTKHPLLV